MKNALRKRRGEVKMSDYLKYLQENRFFPVQYANLIKMEVKK